MAELFQEIFDDAKIFESLDKLEKKLVETGASGEEAAKGVSDAFKEVREFIEGFIEGLADASKEIEDSRKATEQARKENATWAKSVKDLIGNFQIGGQSLSQWAQQIRGFAGIVRDGSLATEGASKSMRIFSTALKATGIGLIIAAVASLIGYFTRFQSGVDKVNQVLAATSAVFDKMIGGFKNFGSAIVKVFQGDFSGALDAAKQGVEDLTTGLVDAATDAYNLEKAFQDLRDTTLRASVETARQRAELEKLKAVADDGTLSISRRMAAQKEAGKVEQEIANRTFANAEQDLKLKQQQLDSNEENAQFIQEEAKAQEAYFDAKATRDAAQINSEKALRELRKTAAEERKKQLEDERKALEALQKEFDRLKLASLAGTLEGDQFAVTLQFEALIKSAQDQAAKLKEIAKSRNLTPDELKRIEELGKLEIVFQDQLLSALNQAAEDFNEKEKERDATQRERKEALAKNDYDRAINALEAEKKLTDEQINLQEEQNKKYLLQLEAQGASEEELKKAQATFDLFIQAARLQNELQFQETLLSITDKGDTERVKQIEATIETLKAKITNLQIDVPGKKGDKPKSIFELLGIDEKGAELLDQATAQIVDSINRISQARVDAAEREVDAINKRIEEQESAVNRELEIAKEGLANNLALEKERLDELKKQRDKAEKEAAKARKAQILLDSVQQVSSLITASANIFAASSSLGIFGVPIAIGLIAAMFGAFVAAKAKALKAAEAPKLRKGAKLQGRTHENGGTPLTDSDGTVFAEAEKDEWLIGTRPSKEHDQFLSRLNKGEFAGMDLDRIIPKPGYRNPANEAAHRIRDIETRKADISQDQHWKAMKAAYMEGSREIVQAIKEQPEIAPWNGGFKRTVKKGNITEIETVIPVK